MIQLAEPLTRHSLPRYMLSGNEGSEKSKKNKGNQASESSSQDEKESNKKSRRSSQNEEKVRKEDFVGYAEGEFCKKALGPKQNKIHTWSKEFNIQILHSAGCSGFSQLEVWRDSDNWQPGWLHQKVADAIGMDLNETVPLQYRKNPYSLIKAIQMRLKDPSIVLVAKSGTAGSVQDAASTSCGVSNASGGVSSGGQPVHVPGPAVPTPVVPGPAVPTPVAVGGIWKPVGNADVSSVGRGSPEYKIISMHYNDKKVKIRYSQFQENKVSFLKTNGARKLRLDPERLDMFDNDHCMICDDADLFDVQSLYFKDAEGAGTAEKGEENKPGVGIETDSANPGQSDAPVVETDEEMAKRLQEEMEAELMAEAAAELAAKEEEEKQQLAQQLLEHAFQAKMKKEEEIKKKLQADREQMKEQIKQKLAKQKADEGGKPKAAATKSEEPKTTTTKSEATKAAATKSEATKAAATNSEATKTAATNSEATKTADDEKADAVKRAAEEKAAAEKAAAEAAAAQIAAAEEAAQKAAAAKAAAKKAATEKAAAEKAAATKAKAAAGQTEAAKAAAAAKMKAEAAKTAADAKAADATAAAQTAAKTAAKGTGKDKENADAAA